MSSAPRWNQGLFNLPFAFCAPLLHHAPSWLFMLIVAEGLFQNNWSHHSKNAAHPTANLGSRLTIWDRLFETYVDPETAGEISFGIEGRPSPARLALGL